MRPILPTNVTYSYHALSVPVTQQCFDITLIEGLAFPHLCEDFIESSIRHSVLMMLGCLGSFFDQSVVLRFAHCDGLLSRLYADSKVTPCLWRYSIYVAFYMVDEV